MKSYLCGRKLLNHLRNFNMPQVSKSISDAKDDALVTHFGVGLLEQRNALRAQPGWCHALPLIARNVADSRGIVITALPNEDTYAVLLATRLGIDARLAVALAYDDLIKVFPINDDQFCDAPAKIQDYLTLATFRAVGEETSDTVLMAHKNAQSFKLRFQPEELILYDQHPEHGLFRPYDLLYFQKRGEAVCSFRTNEKVFYEVEGETLPLAHMSPNDLEVFRAEMSKPFVPTGPKKGWDGEMRKHVERLAAKHLGPNLAVGMSVNRGPYRFDL